jgi:hypothetical protein
MLAFIARLREIDRPKKLPRKFIAGGQGLERQKMASQLLDGYPAFV